MKVKICGIKDKFTLKYIINHRYPPEYIGFISNYPKSTRNLEYHKLGNFDYGIENRSNVSQISKYKSHRILYEFEIIEKIKNN